MTPGVVRVADTVRRPAAPNAAFVRALLKHLEAVGFDAAPRSLGTDELGREVLTFLEGGVPPDLDPAISDDALTAAGELIRRFHDACDDVCHHDLSPCNFVFREGEPVGIIDFDAAAPGERLQDVGYALFTWLNVGTEYGIAPGAQVVDAIMRNVGLLRADGRLVELEWWEAQLLWLRSNLAGLSYAA